MREILVWDDLDKRAVSTVFNKLCRQYDKTRVRQLAKLTDFSIGYISMIKTGKHLPKKRDLENFVHVVSDGQVSFSQFMSDVLSEQERRATLHETLANAKKNPMPCLIPIHSNN